MIIEYIAHSAFSLSNDGGSILIDPFITGNPLATQTADDFSPQAIILTHAHNDHVGDTFEIAKRTGATVICTFELGEWLEGQGLETMNYGNHGGTLSFPGGTSKIVPAWHTSSYTTEDGQVVAPGVPAGQVVRYGGKTIYFAGDTCLFGDMRLIGEESIDIAVLPIGDHFTMGPEDAARAVRLIEPDIVIPCHYNTFPEIEQNPLAFKALVESTGSAVCEVLEPGQSLELA
jgi:L-ascorbate metabolism protein UlaG (beta-lactamase superfamily)